jgi:hypothetical protein
MFRRRNHFETSSGNTPFQKNIKNIHPVAPTEYNPTPGLTKYLPRPGGPTRPPGHSLRPHHRDDPAVSLLGFYTCVNVCSAI